MDKKISIAIDGPSGAGKSTMARRVAEQLGYVYVDTGAIYRTVGYHMDFYGIGPKDTDGVTRLIDDVDIEMVYDDQGVQHMVLNGEDVSGEIRSSKMSAIASAISAQPVVRAYLLDLQRNMAEKHNVIMDGRDIGTVVLPWADVKIFLTASAEKRAERRYAELLEKGEKTSLKQVLTDMEKRDYADSHRKIAPLKPAKQAVTLDTSDLDIDQSIDAILQIIQKKLGK